MPPEEPAGTENPVIGISPSLGDAAVLPTIQHGKKKWTIGAPTQRAKSALEELAVEIAVANVERLKGKIPLLRYKQIEDDLTAKIEGGHYLTWGSLWTNISTGPDGQTSFLCALLRERHEEATLDDARALYRDKVLEVRRALARVLPVFFSLLAEGMVGVTVEERELAKGETFGAFLSELEKTPGLSPTPSS